MRDLISEICYDHACLPICPTCAETIEGFDYACEIEQRTEIEKMWPDGPIVEILGLGLRIVPGSQQWTARPCGHLIPSSALVFISHAGPEHP